MQEQVPRRPTDERLADAISAVGGIVALAGVSALSVIFYRDLLRPSAKRSGGLSRVIVKR